VSQPPPAGLPVRAATPPTAAVSLPRRAAAKADGTPAAGYAALLGALAIMWGSSYLFIKIGVATLPPLSLVVLRAAVGLACLLTMHVLTRVPFPRDRRTHGHLAVLATVNLVLPFWLISWAEQRIDSGLAGLLQSSGPFFTLLIAAAFIHDERITRGRLAGIGLGFAGIVLLSSEDLVDLGNPLGADRLVGELAVVLGSLCYAIGNTYARRHLRTTRPLVLATGQVGWSVVIVAALALVIDGGIALPPVPEAALAIGWLGVVGTGLAYVAFFRLLGGWGPTRASLVSYLLPVVAVVLGVVILGERIDALVAAGAALIVAGVWTVNRRG